ncbi:PREDICTED: interleukin-3 receptor subunit alpha [Chrysochloris asiatica]|uniref:Interleukin-3 receptor subunit alpha n=1 Tax=Chrysochloris asiatica TaxID=185453 RepID=A0A9B0U5V0_CHRAS|nr:PREDICTED: interleukin-3 receptor subunit alpha [Chrysochloris asiatica]
MSPTWLTTPVTLFLVPICCLLARDPDANAINNSYCQLIMLSFCKMTNYTIKVTKGTPFSTWIQYPKPEGEPGAAAANLTCWIQDAHFLQCSWAVGHSAPGDVQYHLYLLHISSNTEWACLHYTSDSRGIHTGCRFDNISTLKNLHYQFLVKATSAESGVPCTERYFTLSKIEILRPPNITVTCNTSYALMEWKMFSYFNQNLMYELQIQKDTNRAHPESVTMRRIKFYELVNPGTFTVSIRVNKYMHPELTWSEWSSPQRFECDQDRSLRPWQVAVSIALGMLLAFLLVGLLCRRYSVMQKIFPPMPWKRDPVQDFLQSGRLVSTKVNWEASPASWEDCPVEKTGGEGAGSRRRLDSGACMMGYSPAEINCVHTGGGAHGLAVVTVCSGSMRPSPPETRCGRDREEFLKVVVPRVG